MSSDLRESTGESSPDTVILIVEDQPDIAELAQIHLAPLATRIEVVSDGLAALRAIEQNDYDLVVLDLGLPSFDGVDLCRAVRHQRQLRPGILMLTARSSEADRVRGLEAGADDYLVKPFGVRELVARSKTILRRLERGLLDSPTKTGPPIRHADILLDPACRTVEVRGEPVELTPREFDLLACFLERPGRVLTRAEILDRVWGPAFEGFEHTVNSHINRLRQKVERDPVHPQIVLTVRGVGYKAVD